MYLVSGEADSLRSGQMLWRTRSRPRMLECGFKNRFRSADYAVGRCGCYQQVRWVVTSGPRKTSERSPTVLPRCVPNSLSMRRLPEVSEQCHRYEPYSRSSDRAAIAFLLSRLARFSKGHRNCSSRRRSQFARSILVWTNISIHSLARPFIHVVA